MSQALSSEISKISWELWWTILIVCHQDHHLNNNATSRATATLTASTTTVDDLNRCFQIPRGAKNFQPHVESQPNLRPSASTNANDLNCCFQIPRSLQCASPQPESHSNSQPFSQPTLTDNSLSSGFARANYGATSARGTAQRRPWSNRSSNTIGCLGMRCLFFFCQREVCIL